MGGADLLLPRLPHHRTQFSQDAWREGNQRGSGRAGSAARHCGCAADYVWGCKLMGKRSDFARIPRDFYPTPIAAVLPLLPHLPDEFSYWEPCAGDGALINHLADHKKVSYCAASDIEPRCLIPKADALEQQPTSRTSVDYIITNPPWDRKILHPMIAHFSAMRPTWLLFDADWIHTRQSAPYMPWLRKIVSVGRVKWIPDSKMTGKDNCSWHLFDQRTDGPTEFVGRIMSGGVV